MQWLRRIEKDTTNKKDDNQIQHQKVQLKEENETIAKANNILEIYVYISYPLLPVSKCCHMLIANYVF